MGDHVLRIIPVNPAWVPDADHQRRAQTILRALLPAADRIESQVSAAVRFIDQGSPFTSVQCPHCEADLMGPWHTWMDAAADTGFSDLQVTTPCCEARVSLNDLHYEWPAGFARFALEAWNPRVEGGWLLHADVDTVGQALGCKVRQIRAHY